MPEQFKVRWQLQGGHVHALLYSMPMPSRSWVLNGELVFSQIEFHRFVHSLAHSVVEPEWRAADAADAGNARGVRGRNGG